MRKLCLAVCLFAAASLQALDLSVVEDLVFEKTNAERSSRGLPLLERMTALDDIARIHSENMVEKKFFSHTDHQKRSPSRRMAEYYPRIVGAVGENIAMHYGNTEEQVAQNLVTAWMNSPGHRANILRKSFTHLGIGAARNETHVFATQNFGTPIAELALPEEAAWASSPVYRNAELPWTFRYLAKTPIDRLTIYVKFPNSRARHTMPGGRYYTGVAPAQAKDAGDGLFTLDFVPLEVHGKGAYRIAMGFDGSVYDSALSFTATDAPQGEEASPIPESEAEQETPLESASD